MIFNLQTIDKLSQKIIETLKRFPLASFSAFIFTIIIITLMELDYLNRDSSYINIATKIAFVSSLGIILFPTLKLFWSNFLMSIVGILLLIGYYYILPTNITTENHYIFVRHFFLILATFLMFIWTPFISVKISNKNIWEWTQNFILVLLSTMLFSLILYSGISLALYSIEKLFNIYIPTIRYAQLAILVFGIYGVNLFLSQIPKYILLLQVRTYTKAEIIFTKYILTPLTIGYFLILVAYSTKILFTMQWPSGIVSWISILFSLVAITTYLFWTPLWEKENIQFKRAIWIAILLQTIMLGLSIWMRIDEYGITESRYFVALFGSWLVLMSFYFIFVKEASYKWLFVTLTILLIGSQFGKYSAIEVSKKDQISRLGQLLKDKKNISENLSIKDKKNIYSKINYLYSTHGIDSLNSVIPQIIQEYKENNITTYFPLFATKKLGITDRFGFTTNRYKIFNTKEKREVINITGYQYIININYEKNLKNIYNINNNILIKLKDNNISIINNKTISNLSLDKFLETLNKNNKEYNQIDSSNMIYEYIDNKIKVKFLFDYIILENNIITTINGNMLISIN